MRFYMQWNIYMRHLGLTSIIYKRMQCYMRDIIARSSVYIITNFKPKLHNIILSVIREVLGSVVPRVDSAIHTGIGCTKGG